MTAHKVSTKRRKGRDKNTGEWQGQDSIVGTTASGVVTKGQARDTNGIRRTARKSIWSHQRLTLTPSKRTSVVTSIIALPCSPTK
jgi:hypothetical protein